MAQTAGQRARNASATRELAATAQEIARTAGDLAGVAEGLRGVVGKFKLQALPGGFRPCSSPLIPLDLRSAPEGCLPTFRLSARISAHDPGLPVGTSEQLFD
jgi:hypothetical protein